MDAAYNAAVSSDRANELRLFIPTRPSLLHAEESVRIYIVLPGQASTTEVRLCARRLGDSQWKVVAADHAGRSVYAAQLGPFQANDVAIEYYATAPGRTATLTTPPQAPDNLYTLTVLDA
jgi:hypothetical protein